MTVLWDNNGTEQWRTTYDNNNGNDTVKDLTINYSGVYVTGCSESSGPKATTIKYNFSGGQDWVNNEFAGCNNSIQIFERQIGYGVKGPTTRLTDVFTTGYSGLYPSNCSGQTIRYTISGGVDWRKIYSTNRQLDLLSLKLDNAENVIVTGFDFSGNIFGNPVGYTIKYNNAGVLQWVNTLSSHSFLWLFDLALDPSGNAFVAGTASNDYIGNSIPVFENELNMSAYYITTKYETDNGGDNQDNFNSFTANKYNLSQNHPNPFNPSTTIKYSIPYSGFVSIKVYDMLGREIVQLANEFKESGNYDVIFDGSNLSSGVYIYRLQAGLFSDMKKMILIR